jgi:hypothetical protein
MAWLKVPLIKNHHVSRLGRQAGLSLLGTLLAAFLLATTAAAVSQLIARSERASQSSRARLVATTVGREGLELVRAMRDTNWFLRQTNASHHWLEGICVDSGTGEQISGLREFTLDSASVRNLNPVGDHEHAALAIQGNDEWTHETTGRATLYQRKLSVDCSDQDVSILVTATVTWPGANRQEQTWTVSERLYDWLP